MRRHTARAMTTTAAALAFVLAGSAVAAAEPGDATDHPDTDKTTDRPIRDSADHRRPDRVTDHPTDPPVDRPANRPVDHPTDRPIDRPTDRPHPCDREPTSERPDRCRNQDREEKRTLWQRCKQVAETDTAIDDEALKQDCRRLQWHRHNWKRCLHWAAEDTDVRPTHRHLWILCHRWLSTDNHPS